MVVANALNLTDFCLDIANLCRQLFKELLIRHFLATLARVQSSIE